MSRIKMKPLLWQTTNREVPCHFLGTMHIADTWYNVVPKSLLRTFDACDVLCVEFNILRASKLQQKVAGAALKKAVPKDILNKVVRTAKKTRRRIEKSSRLTPKNMQIAGLDGFLLERAAAAEQQVVSVETFDEQMESMKASRRNKNRPIVDAFANHQDDPIEQIRHSFLGGDAEFFKIMSMDIWGPEATSWCDRHIKMSQRLLDYLQIAPEKSFFVALGAIHFLSPASVLEMIGLGGIATERV